MGDDFVFVLDAAEGHVFGQRTVCDDDCGGMCTNIASQAFDFAGQVEELVDLVVGLVGFFQVDAFLERLVQCDVECAGDHGDDGVDPRDGDTEGTADIADGGASGQRSKGADLGDVFGAVFFFHVLDDFAAAVFAEVDVDIRRFAAIEIEEAFEQEIEFEGADVAEIKCVGDQ